MYDTILYSKTLKVKEEQRDLKRESTIISNNMVTILHPCPYPDNSHISIAIS